MNTGKTLPLEHQTCEFPNIFVGGISSELSPSEVREHLAQFGHIDRFEMPRDPVTKLWKGYAKVYIRKRQTYKALLSQESHWVRGFKIGVKPWVDISRYLSHKDDLNSRKLFVKYKPIMSEQQLYSYFSRFGPIASIDCKVDSETKKPRNFAFVVFDHDLDAQSAVMDGSVVSKSFQLWCTLTTPKYLMDRRDLHDSRRNHNRYTYYQHGTSTKMRQPDSYRVASHSSEMVLSSHVEIQSIVSPKRINDPIYTTSIELIEVPKSGNEDSLVKNPKPIPPIQLAFQQASITGNNQPSHLPGDNQGSNKDSDGARLKVGWTVALEEHHWKPTSKRCPQSARSQIADNHRAVHNLLFRLSRR